MQQLVRARQSGAPGSSAEDVSRCRLRDQDPQAVERRDVADVHVTLVDDEAIPRPETAVVGQGHMYGHAADRRGAVERGGRRPDQDTGRSGEQQRACPTSAYVERALDVEKNISTESDKAA